MLYDLSVVDGWNDLSDTFCNQPVRVSSEWPVDDEPVAVIFLCGRDRGHEGNCDPVPPLSEFQGVE